MILNETKTIVKIELTAVMADNPGPQNNTKGDKKGKKNRNVIVDNNNNGIGVQIISSHLQ